MLSVNLLPGRQRRFGDSSRRRCGWRSFPKTSPTPTPRAHRRGGPYQRQVVRFETVMKNQFDAANAVQQVQVAGIEADNRPHRLIYQPGHPDADPESGMVKFPNVSIHEEMADLISSSRALRPIWPSFAPLARWLCKPSP